MFEPFNKVVDPDQPLETQGPFDVVLHKINRYDEICADELSDMLSV